MKPGIDQLLMALATTLAARILPQLETQSYATGDARIAALLSVLLAQEADRAADTLARENREMRMLFLAASRLDLIPALRVRLAHDAATEEADLKLSTLSPAHDRYTRDPDGPSNRSRDARRRLGARAQSRNLAISGRQCRASNAGHACHVGNKQMPGPFPVRAPA